MKLAKKVLSVVLALVLALGAFAVVGSANGPVDSDYQVKIWLTGTIGTVEWTTNSKVTIDETGDESDAGATIEVQPGDTVFVRFYITNNYYVHTFQSNVFYSAGLLDAGDVYAEQRGRAITAANIKKIHLWNEDHYWAGLQGTAYSIQNPWSFMIPSFQQDLKNWPVDNSGACTLDQSEWKFNMFSNLSTEGVGETAIFDDDSTHLFMMPVTVPADAKPGDTFYVTIPEGLEQRSTNKNGSLRLSEIGIADGEDEPCDIVDAQSLLNPNMEYSDDNQYFDFSEATITLQVPGGSTEPSVDTAELEAKIAEAAALLTTDITEASKAALNAAITAGNAALSATSQDEIDAAVDALAAAIAAAEGLANYTALNNAIARYEALNPADWSNFAAATEKYDAAKAIASGLGVSAQGTIDAAASALNEAIDALVAALDYSALEAKYNELANKDVANYTDATAGRFNTALADAKALIDNKNAADQAEINAAYDELVAANAALALKAADYSALDEAIAAFEAVDAKAWTPDSYAAAQAKYDVAKAVARDLDITAQATVTAAAEALNDAIAALVPAAGANYAALDAAIAEAEALVADNYVSFADVAAALAAAKNVARDLTANDQATIDAAAKALTDAMAALVEADADYSKVNAAIAAADAILNKKDNGVNSYSDETLAAINEAKATVVTGLKKKDQAQVDAMAAAINAAIASAEFRAWDYTAINAHIAAIEANDADYYDSTSYAAYLAAKEALVMNYTYENYAKAKLQEINFLKVKVTAAPAADYSAVEDAKAAFEAKKAAAEYTAESIAAVEAEIAKVVYGLNANHQAEVDAFAAAINEAIDAMEEVIVLPADYTAVNDAIEAFRAKIAAADYEQAGIDAVEAIIAGINWNLDETAQATVNAYAADIIAATAALVEIIPVVPADYTALNAAILRAGTYDQNAWTADTWAVVEEKLAAAKAVPSGLTADDQDQIDDAAEALNAALDALVAKEVVSSISTITYTPAEDTHNTFDVVVNGRMAMVQFIEEDGGTRTYDRYNKNVTIKSYNAEGVEVNSLDRSVAYEIWTINTNLVGPEVKVRTKYLDGSKYVWETEKYSFTLEFVEPTFDADIREITPAATAGKKGKIATTVVVGPDAQGVRFVMDNGTTTTYYAEKATVLENGDLSFTGNAWANHDGLNTIIIKVRVNGAWVEMGTLEYTVE